MKTLLIGYEGYQGRSSNPAAMVACALDGTMLERTEIVGMCMPVIYSDLRARLEDVLALHRPDMVFGLGLWPGEPVVRVERLAYNCADFELPDNEGVVARGERLVPAGPSALEATVLVEPIVDQLLAAGIPGRVSLSAGTFLCNAMFYHLLDIGRLRFPGMGCGFVHLPYLPDQVAAILQTIDAERRVGIYQRADLASMDQAVATRALIEIVTVTSNARP